MSYTEKELDQIIREVIGAERQVLYQTGNSPTVRRKKIKEIIERRAKGADNNDS